MRRKCNPIAKGAGRGPLLSVFLILLFLASSLPAALLGARASQEGDESSLPSRAEQLQVIRREIESLEGRLDQARTKVDDLAGQLEQTALELELQRARVEEAVAAHFEAEISFQAVEAEVGDLVVHLEELRRDLRNRLVLFHRLGGQGYLRLLLAVEKDSDPLSALRQLRYFILTDAQALDRFRALRTELEAQREELLLRQQEVQAWVDAEEARRSEVATVRDRQAKLLARLERDRDKLADRSNELTQRERSLTRFLDLIEREAESEFSGAAIQDFRGALDWPLWGRLVTPFGPRRDPRYGTLVPNNGIEIGSAAGEAVRSVFPGKVLYAATFQDYGFTVVVQHRGSVLTLYAGLSELEVERGDMLDLGDPVGLSTEILYFEIRLDTDPQNPLGWLR